MRVLVCGGRDFIDAKFAFATLDALHKKHHIDVLIQGEASGADRLGKNWAVRNKIPTLDFPANWALHGRRAGHVRNHKMLRDGQPDVVVAFPGGRGTAHMVEIARQANIRVWDLSEKYKTWWSRDPFAG